MATATASAKAIQGHILATYEQRNRRSCELYRRAQNSMPGGDTRSITFYPPYPTFIDEAQGCRVTDADGNEYIDYLNNYTALVHGHAHEKITTAIAEQAAKGTCQASPVKQQIELAEALVGRIPAMDRVRFCNSGTEAILNVVRVARAFTGRLKILKMAGGYHGMWETVQVSVEDTGGTGSSVGRLEGPGLSPRAAEETLVAPFNDLETTAAMIRKHRGELAAVLVEPVLGAAGMIPAEPAFLQGLQDVCRETGVLLVADEIITLRLAVGGAQSAYGIEPDLTTLGKLIGGGLAVGAFGGRAEVMAVCDPRGANPVFHSGTFTASAITMAAGRVSLELLDRLAIEKINRLGDRLRSKLQEALDDGGAGGCVTGTGSLLQVQLADPPIRSAVQAHSEKDRIRPWLHLALLNRGIMTALRGLYSLSTVMGEAEIDTMAERFRDAFAEVMPLLQDLDSVSPPPALAAAAVGGGRGGRRDG